jgi:hypothetical protein
MWPLYLIGGLIAAAIAASMVFGTGPRTGDVILGGQCNTTADCRDDRDVCHAVKGRSICVRSCYSDASVCLPGTKCASVTISKRRRQLRMLKLCLPE